MAKVQLTDESFQALSEIIYELTGVSVDDTKRSLLKNRLGRRVRELELDSMEEYIELLQDRRGRRSEVKNFVDVVTTHKTSFFRTTSVWDAIEKEVNDPPSPGGRFTAWSGASSTGQEAYSMAMLLASQAPPTIKSWSIQASDVSPLTVARAEKGEYALDDVNGAAALRPTYGVESYFEGEGETRTVVRSIRDRVRFKTHNLLERMNDSFDVVFLRNVIIYFSEEDKRRVIGHAIEAVKPGGLLILGESESMCSSEPRVNYEGPCLYRKIKS